MISRRTVINIAAIAAASAALLLYAFTRLLVGAFYDTTYPIAVVLPESGGLLAGQEVTLSGRVIGRVGDVRLEDEVVVAELAIRRGEDVPSGVRVTVLRRSPIGEQAIDLRPQGTGQGTGQGTSPVLEPGARVNALDATTPVPVQRLLELANEVFAPIDPERAGVLVAELADAVRGRRDDLRGLIGDSATFSAAIAAGEADIERFFSASRRVNAALAQAREPLAGSIGDMADATEVLVRIREDFRGLLAEAPTVLGTLTDVVERSQANLSCDIRSFANLNSRLASDETMADLEEALRLNQWFFVGFDIGGPRDPAGRAWNRILFIPPQEASPDSYLPEKRPIPDILPGGACVSPFGAGAPAATQSGFTPVTVENEIVPLPGEPADEPPGGDAPNASAPQAIAGATSTAGPDADPLAIILGAGLLGATARGIRRNRSGAAS